MKKLMSLMLGLALLTGATAVVFGQTTTSTTKTKKAKKAKKTDTTATTK
jgi:hypothetical protein